jgi:hypothetical protein
MKRQLVSMEAPQLSPFDLPELMAMIVPKCFAKELILVSKSWMRSIMTHSKVCDKCGKIVAMCGEQIWVGDEGDQYCHGYLGTLEEYHTVIKMISIYPDTFKLLSNKTKQLCVCLLSVNRNLVSSIPTHLFDEEIALFAINKFRYETTYKCIPKEFRTNNLHKVLISQNTSAISYIPQTPELCLMAVSRNGYVLGYIEEQTEEMCLIAFKDNIKTIKHIKNITPKILELAIELIGKNDENLCQYLLTKIQSPSMELLRKIISISPKSISYIPEYLCDELIFLALEKEPYTIRSIKNPTNKQLIYAFNKNPRSVDF